MRRPKKLIGICVLLATCSFVLASCKRQSASDSSVLAQISKPKSVKPKTVKKRSTYFGKIGAQSLEDIRAKTAGKSGHPCKKLPKKKNKVVTKDFRCERRSLRQEIDFYQCENEKHIKESIRKIERSKDANEVKSDKNKRLAATQAVLILARSEDACRQAFEAILAVKAIQAKAMIDAFQNILDDDDYDSDY